MLRLLVVIAAAAAAVVLPARAGPAGPKPQRTVLLPDVTYERVVTFSRFGPKVVHVVTAPRPGGLYTLRPVLSNGVVQGKEPVTAIERRLAPAATTVALNGDLSNAEGVPAGTLIQSGALVTDPDARRSSIGFDAAGNVRVERLALAATWQGSGQRRPLGGINRRPGANGVSLYTPAWGTATPAEPGSVEAVLAGFGTPVVGGEHTGSVTQVRQGGATPIPPGGAVLVGRGSQAARVTDEAKLGAEVTARLVPNPDWRGVVDGLGGGPALVRAGKAIFNAREEFSLRELSARTARAAIAQRADGRILLVAVDGGLPGFSVGMTNYELAQTLVRLGAVTAAALEGGTAATLAFDGKLLNRPARGERPVSEALTLLYQGVYAAPPDPTVVSPNGDGIAERQTFTYRVPRPSRVTVTLVDPAGAQRVVETADRAPGTYRLPWTGKLPDGTLEREGPWRWLVAAQDDLGRGSSMEQPFWLNNTLGALRLDRSIVPVARRGGRLAVSFTLAHPAQWTATIETAGGTVVRAYPRASAQAGPVTFGWDGRYGKGVRAFAGRYVVRVVATNELGSTELTGAFAVRRVGR